MDKSEKPIIISSINPLDGGKAKEEFLESEQKLERLSCKITYEIFTTFKWQCTPLLSMEDLKEKDGK